MIPNKTPSGIPIIWIVSYFLEVDGLFAIPVRDLEPARIAIKKGIFHLVTEDEAKEINSKFLSHCTDADKEFMENMLFHRSRILNTQ